MTIRKLATVAFALATLLVASSAVTSSLASGGETEVPTHPGPGYATNESGMSYGSDFGKNVSPDLILATGDDGTPGYVKREDVYGPDDVTLEDALRQMSSGENQARTIPLYAEDGVSVIGSFTLAPSGAGHPEK